MNGISRGQKTSTFLFGSEVNCTNPFLEGIIILDKLRLVAEIQATYKINRQILEQKSF